MIYPPLKPPPVCDFQVRTLLYAYAPMSVWTFADLSAPYWRVYWNDRPGAWMELAGRRYGIGPDRLTLIPPNTPYRCWLESPVTHFYLHFTTQSAYAALPSGIYQWPAEGEALSVLRTITARLQESRPGPYLDLLANALAAACLTRVPEEQWPVSVLDRRVQAAMETLKAPAGERVSNEELARRANLSTNGFIRLFTRQAGVSPQQYSLRFRLDHACIMLHHSDKSIDEIAEECGFWDRNYFTRMFKKYRYMTPAVFRTQRAGYGRWRGRAISGIGPSGIKAEGRGSSDAS